MITLNLQEFCHLLQLKQPVLAIDYGTKKMGIAISSPDHLMALPHSNIAADTDSKKLAKILDIIAKNNICAIVVGLPINMDGTNGLQTQIVRIFAQKLAEQVKLPIYLQDERLTSKLADSVLKTMGLNRKKRNTQDDKFAACLILETTLEALKKIS